MRKFKVFLLNGILLTVSSLIMQTISMFFNVYISNKIGTEAIGVYGLIMSVYMFSITLACSGINLATIRIVSEQDAFGMDTGIKKAMKKCLSYSLFMGCLACFLLFTFSSLISSSWLHTKVSPLPIKMLAVSLPFLSLSSCLNGYFSAMRKVKKTVLTQFFEQILKIAFVFYLIKFFMPSGLEYACISLVLGSTLSEILSFVFILFLFLHDKHKLKSKTYTDTNYTKQILKIALPLSFTSYIRSGLSTLKQLLIPARLEKSGLACDMALSQYGIINGMVMPLIYFPCSFISSFSSLLIPEFSYMNAKKERYKINFSLQKIFKICFLFSFLIMGFFWCFSKELNTFIYPNTDISRYIKLLCPLIVLIYIDNIVDSILKGLDKQVTVMGINILDLASSVFLIYFLLPIKGISGYIIVLFISEILNGLISLCVLVKETNLNIDFSNWIIKPFFSILFLIFVFSNFKTINSLIEFIFYGVIFIGMYFVLLILFRSIVKNDFKL